MDNLPESSHRTGWWKGFRLVLAMVWLAFLAYLLLAADPPDFWFDDIGTVAGPGHVVAGFVTGFVVCALVAGRKRALLTAFGITLLVLIGLEVVQDRFTDRGYQSSDVTFSVVGAVLGVGAGRARWIVTERLRTGPQNRR